MTEEQVVDFIYSGEKESRLDMVLVEKFPQYSRSRLQSFIKEGRVAVAGKVAEKGGQSVEKGMAVSLRIPEEKKTVLIPEEIPLNIIYEDDQVIIVNKPAGMVVHPAFGHDNGTLVNAVLAHCSDLKGFGGEIRPGVVHRLDRDTSGLIIMAKNEQAHIFLSDQFKNREVNKRYLALVDGKPPTPNGRVDAPIGRDPAKRQQMAVLDEERGRKAISEYFTKEQFSHHTLIEVHPLTGRTHQIRVHMAFIKCPVAGDRVYGYRTSTIPLDRHFLHAYRLTITLPGHKEPQTFEAPLPQELEDILEDLRRRDL